MKIIAFKIKEELRKAFKEARQDQEQLKEEVEVISYSAGTYGISVPDEASYEECKKDVESILISFGWYCGSDYEFIKGFLIIST